MRGWVILLCNLAFIIAGSTTARAQNAEEGEAARHEAFRASFVAVIDDLNAGSFDKLISAIDKEDFVDRIFGLRLIDQRVKRQFRERLKYDFDGLVKSGFAETKEGVKATLLGFDSRADLGRAVVRFDLPDFQFGYHEYDLRRRENGELVIVDWLDFLAGEKFTDAMGMSLILAAPGKPAVRKLVDFKNIRERELFQLTELLKAARDRKLDRYWEILEGMDERLQRQEVVVLTTIKLSKQVRNRRAVRKALTEMAAQHPEDPRYSLMLLDYYFPTRRYEDAFAALLRLKDRLGVDDAAMLARLSAAALVLGRQDDAVDYAESALAMEDDLELAWWSALRAHAATGDFDKAAAAVVVLERQFDHRLGPEELGRDRSLAGLVASDAYKNRAGDGG